ncbi:MAG: UpxY family transcription antiterminator [Chitinophagaceae bacterium]|nr:MAG: UpxY family transcription antiterminator [Chitinophagaceae bacterium]
MTTAKWLVIYTKPRWEKKVAKLLEEKGVEKYCPLNKVRRKWSDRMKTVEEPLFKSYVFVKIADDDKTKVRMTAGVINFIYWLGKPAVVREKEIENIKRFLDEHENVKLQQMTLQVNQRVKITSGIFMDQVGEVLQVNSKTVKMAIDSLGCMLVAVVEKSRLISST